MHSFRILVFAAILLLLSPFSTAAIELESLLTLKNAAAEGWELKDSTGSLKFYPQSLVLDSGQIVLLNRHEPALAFTTLDQTTDSVTFLRLQHDADKKFNARFFTDLGKNSQGLIAMEASTATLRQISSDGQISNVWIPSTMDGQIIDKFTVLDDQRVLFLDTGTKRVLIRDLAAMQTDKPDETGLTFAFNGSDGLVSSQGIVVLEENEDMLEALLSPLEETEEVIILAAWSKTEIRALDADVEGRFYFYGKDASGSFIERADARSQPIQRERFACPELTFAREATHVARFEKPGSFIILLDDGVDIKIARMTISEGAGK